MSETNTGQSVTNLNDNEFLVPVESVMKTAVDALSALGKTGRLTIIGKGESCPATVSVDNIITQTMLNGKAKTEKIFVGSDVLDDGRLISTIEIVIAKTDNQ